MIRKKVNGLEIFQFASLEMPGLTQAIFSRHGGNSLPPWASLNLGGTVGDNPDHVRANLHKLVNTLEFSVDNLVQIRQVHSANVILADKPMDALYDGDAMVSNSKNLLLLMRYADCVPILLLDKVNKAIGIAHAGWQGTVKEVSYQVVRALEDHFGSKPEDIAAGIGPSIGPDHYYIQEDVINWVKSTFPNRFSEILSVDADGVKLDLWNANRISLERAGVKNIEISGICTACHTKDWFSHRGEKGKTGRFGAVIGLKQSFDHG